MSVEKRKFLALVEEVYEHGERVIACPSASVARSLRRKFYHLKDQLAELDRVRAGNLTYAVKGRRVCITKKDQGFNWTDEVEEET